MNWTAIGALGEIAGAVAVVVSLVYLSVQIRANSRALNVTIRNDVQQQFGHWNQTIMMDARAVSVLHKGCDGGFDALNGEERLQFVHMMFSLINLWESVFEHARDGVFDGAKFTRVSTVFSLFVGSRGGRQYWAKRKMAFDPEFREIIDSIESPELIPASEL